MPMTPVEAMTTWVCLTPSSAAACRAVARASRSPRSPVHALAQPELQTSARILVPLVPRCSSLTRSGAALISLVVTTETPFWSSANAISARSGLRFFIPACTPASFTPGTAPRPPRSSINRVASRCPLGDDGAIIKSTLLRITEHEVEVLKSFAGGAFAQVVERAQDADDAPAPADVKFGVVGPCERDQTRGALRRKKSDEAIPVVRFAVRRLDRVVAWLAHEECVTVGEHSAFQRNDVRREDQRCDDSGAGQLLFDLRWVAVAVEPVGAHVSVDLAEERARRRIAPGTGDAALRVDDQLNDIACEWRERQEREQRRRRVATGIRDEPRTRDRVAVALGQTVHRFARVCVQTKCVGKIDHARPFPQKPRGLLARTLRATGQHDRIPRLQERLGGAGRIEGAIEVAQQRDVRGDRLSRMRRTFERAELEMRMSRQKANEFAGAIPARPDDVDARHLGLFPASRSSTSSSSSSARLTAAGDVDPVVCFARTEASASSGALKGSANFAFFASAVRSRWVSARPAFSAMLTAFPTRRCA